jgi:hypothetical protein
LPGRKPDFDDSVVMPDDLDQEIDDWTHNRFRLYGDTSTGWTSASPSALRRRRSVSRPDTPGGVRARAALREPG